MSGSYDEIENRSQLLIQDRPMRLFCVLLGAGTFATGAPLAAQPGLHASDDAPSSALAAAAAADTAEPVTMDTPTRIRFNLPARPLPDALSDFSRQAAMRVEVDLRAAAQARSHAVAGTF